MVNILFICKFNRFRSRVAEAYFKKINKDKMIGVKSAGLIEGSYPLNPAQVKEAKRFGLNINGLPKGISTKLLVWHDILVIVADDVSKKIFSDSKRYGKKIVVLKVKDNLTGNGVSATDSIKKVIKKVDWFNKKLVKGKWSTSKM